jgi:COP9 signalosome complex subunit 1
LKAAIGEAKKGKDIRRYTDAVECLRIAGPSEPEAEFDRTWLDQTEKANKAETHRLELELKGYKNNLIKESIRVSCVTTKTAEHQGADIIHHTDGE